MENQYKKTGKQPSHASRLILALYKEIIHQKKNKGSRIMIQKLQQKVDELVRQAGDKQETNKKH
jgi:ribosomal protein L17|tara:strand:+ start:209 stop:400 length:192 start_codon:yes stop_codon:yes gene_type:complete